MLFAFVLLAIAASVQSCTLSCQMNYLPVCGTDGVTYGNLCQLNAVACQAKSNVVVAHEGVCQAAVCKTACQFSYSPVCGTDGVTYGNRCQLESTACLQKSGVVVSHVGECVHAQLAPSAVACKVACQRNYEPVCGSDGSTFSNRCQLEAFACTKRLNIQIAHLGAC